MLISVGVYTYLTLSDVTPRMMEIVPTLVAVIVLSVTSSQGLSDASLTPSWHHPLPCVIALGPTSRYRTSKTLDTIHNLRLEDCRTPSSTLIIGARVVDVHVQYVAVARWVNNHRWFGGWGSAFGPMSAPPWRHSVSSCPGQCGEVGRFVRILRDQILCALVAWHSDLKTVLANNYGIHYQMFSMSIIMMNQGFHSINYTIRI